MKLIFIFLCGLTVLLTGCNTPTNKRAGIPPAVGGPGLSPATETSQSTTAKETFIWGGEFRVSNSNRYKELLRVCQRCGRFKALPGGGFQYQASLTDLLFDEGPNKCENWLTQGSITIQFASPRLPTEATVVFWPRFKHFSSCWGHPFSAKGQALPINEDKGFKITLSPSGLSGQNEVYIRSEETSPPRHSLSVKVAYGGEGHSNHSSRLFSVHLARQQQHVKLPLINYTCQQIPPGPFRDGVCQQ